MRRWLPIALLALACGDDDGFQWEGELPGTTATDYRDVVPVFTVGVEAEDHPFLIDTGAPFTILDGYAFPDQEGLYRVDTMDMWGISVIDYTVVLTRVFAPDTGLDGIIGGDLLRHFALELDYRAGTSTLWDAYEPHGEEEVMDFDLLGGGPSYVPCSQPFQCGATQVPATRIVMRALFEGQTVAVNVIVDTGASAIVLDGPFFDQLDAASSGRPRLEGLRVDTVEGLVPGFLSRVWRVSLVQEDEDVALDDVPILVLPQSNLLGGVAAEIGRPVVALIGGTFLRRHRTTIDYPQRELRFERYLETPHIPTNEFVQPGVDLGRAGDEWVISTVYLGSDAAAEGILEGDILETVDGVDISMMTPAQVGGLVYARPLGAEVRMGLRRPPSDVVEEKLVLVEDLLPSFPPPA